MTYGPLNRSISKRLPTDAEEHLASFQKETVPTLQQMHAILQKLVTDLNAGRLTIGSVTLSQGTGAPSATPATSAAVYFRLDPGVGTSVYAWNGATWSAL